MEFAVPEEVRTAVRLLSGAGFPTYPVGGCVRDLLLHTPPHDWDLCTAALPEETRRVFSGYRTLDTGIKHGTVSVLMGGMQLEITTFRCDGVYTDHRHPESVSFTPDLREDLSRRDFTVNAMALDLEHCGVIDLFGGKQDLESRRIRCVGEPRRRFSEDALRILRAARFSARLGFGIDPDTLHAMNEMVSGLDAVSRERVHQELNGLLLSPAPGATLSLCRKVLFQVLPELSAGENCLQTGFGRSQSVFEHALACTDLAPRDLTVRWAALLHDIAKPACRVSDAEGNDRFPGHPEKGAELVHGILERLKMPRALTERVTLLVLSHDIRISEERVWPLLARLGEEAFDQLLQLKAADLGAGAEPFRARELERFSEEKRRLIREGACLSVSSLALRGEDLIRLGIRGPEIGRTLEKLLSAVVERKVRNTREELLGQIPGSERS